MVGKPASPRSHSIAVGEVRFSSRAGCTTISSETPRSVQISCADIDGLSALLRFGALLLLGWLFLLV